MADVRDVIDVAGERLDPLDELARELVDERRFAGVSVTIADRHRVVASTRHGWRDREAALPMTDDTIVRLYSMTKPVVSTALMTLFDEGRFELDDPVAKYIPSLRDVKVLVDGRLVDPVRPIEIRDALTHTCGMTHELQDTPVAALYREASVNADPSRSLAAFIEVLADLPLAFQPGERWHYGPGIDIAAGLIEAIADQPLGAFLDDRVFTPLGMTDTAFAVPEAKRHRLAAMYGGPDVLATGTTPEALLEEWASGSNERRDVTATYPVDSPDVFARGGFGLFSTAPDYTRFARMLLNEGELDSVRVVDPATVQLIRRNHLPTHLLPFENGGVAISGYGFGFGSSVLMDVAAAGGVGSVGEFGWSGAACTHFWVDPELDLVVVLMAQSMMRMDTPDHDVKALVHQAFTPGWPNRTFETTAERRTATGGGAT